MNLHLSGCKEQVNSGRNNIRIGDKSCMDGLSSGFFVRCLYRLRGNIWQNLPRGRRRVMRIEDLRYPPLSSVNKNLRTVVLVQIVKCFRERDTSLGRKNGMLSSVFVSWIFYRRELLLCRLMYLQRLYPRSRTIPYFLLRLQKLSLC